MEPILQIEHLSITFTQYSRGARRRELPVIRDLSLSLSPGEVTAVVGASGSGKSLLAHAILGLLPYNSRREGSILYKGQELTPRRLEKLRGREISFVPQGVGVVEAAVTVAFALFGIDSATGLAVVIVYRGIVFWLPFLVGAVVIQRIKAFMPLGKRDLKGKAEAMENGLPDKVEAVKQVEASEAAKWETAEARPELEKVPAGASGTATGPGTVPKETK